ncbi:MAG: preprotein translocase subunit SecE [Clostridium sp.]|nr:preprotein translocase subunit SecE [Clostridium sp.]MCM1460526.1 preprotein translocase subunit SecE [Bacteroides sp.]
MAKNKETSPTLKRSWFQELKAEFSKIVWPTKDSLIKQSIVVLVVAILLGGLIYGVDLLLALGLDQILG